MALDIREMSFQNVLNQILKPAGVKVGGFPEEIFIDITDDEKEKWTCNICYLIVNDCRQCDNKHLFCNTCVFAWSMTYGENSQKCPMCRHDQKEYAENKEVNRKLLDKKVRCPEENCSFKSPLKIFLMHSHGKLRFSNNHVDLESLRPARPHGARLLVLPTLEVGPGVSRGQRGSLIRNQLQQGRMMINQMMLLLHLEMQLRQQAISTFSEARQSEVRIQRLDEVLALNEQLNEVGGILSGLLNTPLAGRMSSAQRRTTNSSLESSTADVMTTGNGRTNAHLPAAVVPAHSQNVFQDTETEDDEDSSDDSSSVSSVATTHNVNQDTDDTQTPMVRPPVSRLSSTLRDGQTALEQARQRRSTTQAVLASTTDRPTEPARNMTGQANSVNLLNRRQDNDRSLLSARTREHAVTQTDVQRITNTSDTTGARSTESRPTAIASVNLPSISQTSNSPDVPTRNIPSSTSTGSEPDDTEPLRNTHRMPLGSSALSRVMRDLDQSQNQQITRTTMTTHNPASDITITVSSSTPARRPEPEPIRSENATDGNGNSENVTSEETVSRLLSRNITQINRNSVSRPTNTAQQNPRPIEGSILPPSLYRRRSQTQTNILGRSEGGTSSTPSAQHTTEVQGSRRPSLASRTPGNNISRPKNRTVVANSLSTGRSQIGLSNPSTTSSSSRQPNPSRAPTNNATTARANRPSNSIATSRSRDTAAAARNQTGNSSLLSRSKRLEQNNSVEGVPRSRRRSEIHHQLLMRKEHQ